jgi:osmotically-inducible protein OsmY
MKSAFRRKLLVSVTLLSLTMVVSVLGQSGPSSDYSVNVAGHSIKQSAPHAADVAVEVYNGTATTLRDAKITAQVKIALDEDSATEHSEIHVRTSAGVVTLTGGVPSSAVAMRVEQLTQSTTGVREVVNRLMVSDNSGNDQHAGLALEIVLAALSQPRGESH